MTIGRNIALWPVVLGSLAAAGTAQADPENRALRMFSGSAAPASRSVNSVPVSQIDPSTAMEQRLKIQAIRLNDQGLQLLFKGDRQAGSAKLKQALANDPDNPTVLYNLAGVSLSEKDPIQAVAFMKRAVTIEPNDAAFLNRLADAYVLDRDFASAIRAYEQILRQDPANGEVLLKIGTLYGVVRKWELAEASLHKARAILGDDPRVLTNLGSVLVSQRRYRAAIDVLKQCRNDCESSESEVALGIAYESIGNVTRALDHYRRAMMLGDNGKDLQRHVQELQRSTLSGPPAFR